MDAFQRTICRLAIRCNDEDWLRVKSALAEHASEQGIGEDLMATNALRRGRDSGFEHGFREGESGTERGGKEIAGDATILSAAADRLRGEAARRRLLATSTDEEFARDFPDVASIKAL
jgi:hypothetical protein